ncbi:MAG: arabinogalactan oligomer / maltooligosaccharide transport system substrate-binding protein [Micromonosporaceae bacterium]|nr:arabinogalactan oligomer / maltooligosaccharide transport system substrate-binding protein [Micromonosporaceae bacterium]
MHPMGAVNPGDLPTWVSAVASLFAVIGAAIAARQAGRIYRLESARDEAAREEQRDRDRLARRAQGALVSGWWGYDGKMPAVRNGNARWGAFVRNASELPVFRATVTIVNRTSAELAESFDLPAIPPAGQPVFHAMKGTALTEMTKRQRDGWIFDYRVALAYTDSYGRRWIRDQHGALHECDGALTVLADGNRTEVLSQPLSEFAARYGVRLTMRPMDFFDLQPEFLAAVRSGDCPDIVIGVHDWLGNLLGHDAIEPLELSPERRADFHPRAIAALTRHDVLWGMPYAVENLALFRNPELVPDAPATLEQLVADGERLIGEGRTTHVLALPCGLVGDAYHAYPLYAAAGGYLMRERDGGFEVDVDGPAGIAAFTRFAEFGERHRRVLQRSTDHDSALSLFISGRSPFLLSGPWALPPLRRAGAPYAISPIPGFADGPPAVPLVGVPAAFLAKGGKNTELARLALTEVLCRADVAAAMYRAEPRPPAQLTKVVNLDADTRSFQQAGRHGMVMPSDRAMIQVFDVFGRAVAACVGGEDAEPTARAAGREIRRLLEIP